MTEQLILYIYCKHLFISTWNSSSTQNFTKKIITKKCNTYDREQFIIVWHITLHSHIQLSI